jgi:hypothetical protein
MPVYICRWPNGDRVHGDKLSSGWNTKIILRELTGNPDAFAESA